MGPGDELGRLAAKGTPQRLGGGGARERRNAHADTLPRHRKSSTFLALLGKLLRVAPVRTTTATSVCWVTPQLRLWGRGSSLATCRFEAACCCPGFDSRCAAPTFTRGPTTERRQLDLPPHNGVRFRVVSSVRYALVRRTAATRSERCESFGRPRAPRAAPPSWRWCPPPERAPATRPGAPAGRQAVMNKEHA